MRLSRLGPLRYGHLTDAALAFSDDARMHVVLGANEAGKSTTLAAIADALFGFGHRTAYDFLHRGSELRIGFALAASDLGAAQFFRRKGRRETLLDDLEQPLPESALQPYLRGSTRDLFEQAFGLDTPRLRKGADELLQGGGDAGESLLAGIGLLQVREVLKKLDEDAKTLHGDGRGRRRLAACVDAWREAERLKADAAIQPRDYQVAEQDKEKAEAERADLQAQGRALRQELSRLNRVRRIAPILTKLDDARLRYDRNEDAPALPADAGSHLAIHLHAKQESERDAARNAADVERLTAESEHAAGDPEILAVQDGIDALFERRAVIVDAENDLPKVEAALGDAEAKLRIVMEAIAPGLSVEAACRSLPPSAPRRALETHITTLAVVEQASETARTQHETARRHLAEAEARLRDTPKPLGLGELKRAIEAAQSERRIEDDLAKALRARAAAERSADTALAALPLWRGDMAALLSAALPLEADEAESGARLRLAEEAAETARIALAKLRHEHMEAAADIIRLETGEPVPTTDAVAEARAARDKTWRVVRRVLEGGDAPTSAERDLLPAPDLPDAFEHLRDEADRIADRRADEAQRVAFYIAACARAADLARRIEAAERDLASAGTELAAAREGWHRLWEPCGLLPATPDSMRQWRRDRAEVVRLQTAAEQARAQCEDVAERRSRIRAGLAIAVPPLTADEPLSDWLRRAEALRDAADTADKEHERCRLRFDTARMQCADLQHALENALKKQADWQAQFSRRLSALDLAPETEVPAAKAWLDAWSEVEKLAPKWESDTGRIGSMRAAVQGFASAVNAVAQDLGIASEDRAVVLIASLARRLAAARVALQRSEERQKQIAKHQEAEREAKGLVAEAAGAIATLQERAGVADLASLEVAIARAAARDVAERDIQSERAALLAEGDGFDEAALRAEAAQSSADAAVARIAEIDDALTSLDGHVHALTEASVRASGRLEEMERGRNAAVHAQAAADALAEAGTVARRYARLHVARTLLHAGIERFRAAQQDPLLASAGGHFALLTDNRYVRLVTDEDDQRRTVILAERDNGTHCPMHALSEGTRDQLYLALRVAAVERQVAAGVALPFIADDLLVNFDDARASAALKLLCRLGATTQVILFTHHAHIADLASSQSGAEIVTLNASG